MAENNFKIVRGKRGKKSWFENNAGKRITKKFVITHMCTEGPLIKCITQKGMYAYSAMQERLYHSKNNISIKQLFDNIFAIKIPDNSDKMYLYNREGKFLTEEITQFGFGFSNGLIPAKSNELWGYVDEDLNWVIQPQFPFMPDDFDDEGYATTMKNNRQEVKSQMSVINRQGEIVITGTNCKKLIHITGDLYKLILEEGEEIINEKHEVVIPPIYEEITMNGGYFVVKRNSKYGVFDNNGNEIFECIYPEVIDTGKKLIVPEFQRQELNYININKS